VVHIARRVAASEHWATDPGYEATERRVRQTLLRDWTPRNAAAHEENVEVYSNCEQVELFLNDKSLGSQPLPADAAPRIWKVPFEAGTLRAVGKNQGKEAASDELRTAGKPAKIVLTADRPRLTTDWEDVGYVTAAITDEKGVQCPGAGDLVTFKLSGPGTIAAVDNGDPCSHEPFQASQRRASQGQCIAILKAGAPGGKLTLTASAPGLADGTVSIETAASGAGK
jgi:beta-galactosidase